MKRDTRVRRTDDAVIVEEGEVLADYCDLCGVASPVGVDVLCPTCMRFAHIAREHGYADCRGAFIAMEQAMLDGRPGFLLPDRWSPEEIAVLDKAYTVGDVRHRMTWLRLGRSFRAFARPKGGDV